MTEQTTVPCPQCSQPVVMRGEPGQLLRCPACRRVFPAPRNIPAASVSTTATTTRPPPRPRPPAQPAAAPPPPTPSYNPPSYSYGSRRPRVTVAALVCGILFFFPPTALLAVILGLVGIVKTSGRRRGRGFAVAGLILGVVGLGLFAVAVPAVLRGMEMAHRVKCASNLRQIGMALFTYARENKGVYPPTLNELLLTQDITPEVMVCPSTLQTPAPSPFLNPNQPRVFDLTPGTHLSYVYLANAMSRPAAGAGTVVVYEPLTNHNGAGGNVLFGDGRVEFLPRPVMEKAIAELQAGQNPPPSLR
jgi:prepilin-type processing-associated H-X9-DG protein